MRNEPYKVTYHNFSCEASGGKSGYAFSYQGEGVAPHWPMTFDTVSEGIDYIQKVYKINPQFNELRRM